MSNEKLINNEPSNLKEEELENKCFVNSKERPTHDDETYNFSLTSRNKDLIERSFILGVVKKDSARNRKKKRTLREENQREARYEALERCRGKDMESSAKSVDEVEENFDNFFPAEHPLLHEIQLSIFEF